MLAAAYRRGRAGPLQAKLQEIGGSIRPPPYLPERMFPQLRERFGAALDILVEFSTLGEYRLGPDGALCPASALAPPPPLPPLRKEPLAPRKQAAHARLAPGCVPQMGGAGAPNAARAAVRRIVAGGAAGQAPVATPAAGRRPRRRPGAPAAGEQLCLAV
jgi:hypothetical protein